MGKKTFRPYANGVLESKTFPSRYDSIRDTSTSGRPNPSRPNTANPNASPADKPQSGLEQSARPQTGHASTRVAGAGNRPSTPPVDKDLLDGLEGNHRRQRGWEEDSKPNEVVDGVFITPISKAELQKKLAAQKGGISLGKSF